MQQLQQGLHLQQTQRLVMTQELKQAIAILQMSALELAGAVEKELLENPLLDRADDAERAAAGAAADGPPADVIRADVPVAQSANFDWDEYFAGDAFLRRQAWSGRTAEGGEWPFSYESTVAWEPSLADHLTFQLDMATSDPGWRRAGAYFIGSIDDDGYLHCTVEEAAQAANVDPRVANKVLLLLQSFEPAGVSTHNLAECLWVQLVRRGEADALAGRVLREFLPLVAEGKIGRLAALLKVDKAEAQAVVDRIRSCEPRPGRNFGAGRSARYIIPDVVVEKVGDDFVILVEEASAPRLTINSYYQDLLRRGKALSAAEGARTGAESRAAQTPGPVEEGSHHSELREAEHYLKDKLNAAVWFIRSIEQRRRTIHKVATCIVEHQRAFLEKGIKYLRPLTLREVAAEVGVHESTVSRATANKYVQTPQGVFEFKFFFTSGVETVDGDRAAGSVQATMAELIRNEDPSCPASDQEIAACLAKQGIHLSRRTVAKYRDKMGIPPSPRRKRY